MHVSCIPQLSVSETKLLSGRCGSSCYGSSTVHLRLCSFILTFRKVGLPCTLPRRISCPILFWEMPDRVGWWLGGSADARPTALKHTMELFQRKNTCTSVDVDNVMAGVTSADWGATRARNPRKTDRCHRHQQQASAPSRSDAIRRWMKHRGAVIEAHAVTANRRIATSATLIWTGWKILNICESAEILLIACLVGTEVWRIIAK